jgi:hypothetical protein
MSADGGLWEVSGDPPLVNGYLAIGANLSLDTCFVSRVFARDASAGDADLIADLRKTGAGSASIGEWLNTQEYLISIIRKFHQDLAPLRRHGQDIINPFLYEEAVFARWFRDVSERVGAVCCVFADSELEAPPVRQLLLEHLDSEVLGPHFRDGAMVIETGADHFDLQAADNVNRHLGTLLRVLRPSSPVV